MDICKIEGATRVLGGPENWNHADKECSPLPIIDTPDGWMVSQWKPSADEARTIAAGGTVLLWIHGNAHPVVGLAISEDQGGIQTLKDEPSSLADQLAHRNAEVKLLRLALARLQGTLGDQQRLCDIALASTGAQDEAGDL